MPLSERERQILEEIERNLYAEDPGFARQVQRAPRINEKVRARLGVLLFVTGLCALVGFFLSGLVLVGVAAFAAMVGGIVMVAGSLQSVSSSWRADPSDLRARVTGAFERWERNLRDRYKRR